MQALSGFLGTLPHSNWTHVCVILDSVITRSSYTLQELLCLQQEGLEILNVTKRKSGSHLMILKKSKTRKILYTKLPGPLNKMLHDVAHTWLVNSICSLNTHT